jgi:hypothetical protein
MTTKYDIGFLGGDESDDKVTVEMTQDDYEEYKELMERIKPYRNENGKLPGFGKTSEMGICQNEDNNESSGRREFQSTLSILSAYAFTYYPSVQSAAILFRLDSFIVPLCGLINSLF